MLVDLEKGLFVGVVVSLLFYLYRTSQPVVEERAPPPAELGNPRRKLVSASPKAPTCPQLAILRVRGSIYFGAVEHVREALHQIDETDPRRKWVLLVAPGVNFVDLAGAQLLDEEAQRRRALGGGLVVVGPQPAVLHALERSGTLTALGDQALIAHKGDALRAIYPQLDSAQCRTCALRVFEECQSVLPDGTPRPLSDRPILHQPAASTP